MIVSANPHDPITGDQWQALADHYPNVHRIAVALRLAADVETACALLEGRPLDSARIDRQGLRWARSRQLVRLDMHAIDLLMEPTP